MPRLTNTDDLHICRLLQDSWDNDQRAFALLLPHEQWLLHDYYRPVEHVSDAQAIQHRRDITKLRPSLPQQAGRLMRKLARGGHPAARTRSGKVTVRGVANPTLDADQLLQVILAIAAQEGRQLPPQPDGSHVVDTHADDYSP